MALASTEQHPGGSPAACMAEPLGMVVSVEVLDPTWPGPWGTLLPHSLAAPLPLGRDPAGQQRSERQPRGPALIECPAPQS